MITLNLDLGANSYPIYIGTGLLEQSSLLTQFLENKSVMMVTNETIAPLYLEALRGQLKGNCAHYAETILPDGEQHKHLETLNLIFTQLLENRYGRDCVLIALGGGVVGDMTGFAAAAYQRGVDFIQIPTTLLSQVDSSVGGKTGVNHALGKNMIGAFHQPRSVIIDTNTLDTLNDRELSAGLAEVIKYGFSLDAEFLVWLEGNLDALLKRDKNALAYAIQRSCELKAQVVSADEKEKGQRALLNLGHTFGHAIETAKGYGNWLHGEAVGCGMVMAIALSHKLGWLSEADVERATTLIKRANLPIHPPESMTVQQFRELMAIDKKVLQGQLRLILIKQLGSAVVSADTPDDILDSVIAEQLAGN